MKLFAFVLLLEATKIRLIWCSLSLDKYIADVGIAINPPEEGQVTCKYFNRNTAISLIPCYFTTSQAFHQIILSLPTPLHNESSVPITFTKLKTRIHSHEIVNIIIIGGSLTCGSCLPNAYNVYHPDCPEYMTGAYPELLAILLRQESKNSRIIMQNLCERGVGTNVWINRLLEWRQNQSHPVMYADLIIVETAVNDATERDYVPIYGVPEHNHLTQETEVLLSLLLSLPSTPLVMWINAGGIGEATTPVHVNITCPYHIPHLDVIQAFNNVPTKYAGCNWLESFYTADHCSHITSTGHRLVAAYLTEALLHAFPKAETHPESHKYYPNVGNSGEAVSLFPIFVSAKVIQVYDISCPLVLGLKHGTRGVNLRYFVDSNGFESEEDVPGKLGFIGYKVSSYAHLRFQQDVIMKNVHVGRLNIEYLGSYVNMGEMTIRVVKLGFNRHVNPPWIHEVLVSKDVDCLWLDRVSVTATVDIDFDPNKLRDDPSSTLDVYFEIKSSEPPRNVTKIKLLGFILM